METGRGHKKEEEMVGNSIFPLEIRKQEREFTQ